ncbi:hypothetical protein SDC9_167576 [bioreactor metagenome]|uniref:Uncharacterized protein n=1 Tax=bioreactor metagenome TaxID=1076179 RepID=A0A645G047_9ZZZZ
MDSQSYLKASALQAQIRDHKAKERIIAKHDGWALGLCKFAVAQMGEGEKQG